MNKKTAKALEGSIKKWVNIRDNGGKDKTTRNCPLCELFYYEALCGDCPVALRTNDDCCGETPYILWVEHHEQKHVAVAKDLDGLKVHCPECKELADKEVKFLESLRE